MKILVKSLFIALLLTAGYSTTQAQYGGGRDFDPEKRAEQQSGMMADSLSLSDAQATKVKEINMKYGKKFQESRSANSDGDWSAMRETMMKLRQEQDTELKGVLTTDQYNKWTKIQEQQRGERGGPGGRRGGGEGKKGTPKEKQG